MVWSYEEDAGREVAKEGFRMNSTKQEEKGKTYNQLDTGDYRNDKEKRIDEEQWMDRLYQQLQVKHWAPEDVNTSKNGLQIGLQKKY